MLKQYKATYLVKGHYYEESHSCPYEWKGSGVYDYEVPIEEEVDVEVWAKSEEDARRFAEGYWFQMVDWPCPVDDRDLLSVEFMKDLPDRDEDEEGIIE